MEKKKLGYISLILDIIGMILLYFYIGEKSIGNYLKINMIIPLILFIVSVYISTKYKNDWGAKIGKIIALLLICLTIFLTITSFLYKK